MAKIAMAQDAGLKQKISHELHQFFIVFLYLALLIGTFTMYRRLLLAEYHIGYFSYGYALIEALVLAKIIVLGESLGLGERYADRPLIYPTLYKTVLFGLLVLAFSILEHFIGGYLHGKNLSAIWGSRNAGPFPKVPGSNLGLVQDGDSCNKKPYKEQGMVRKYGKKGLIVLLIGVFLSLGLASLALAQKAQELKDAAKMMQNGWTQFNQGQRMVIKGKEMNDLVAVQQGAEGLMGPGNNVIKQGRDTMDQGAKLYAQGLQTYQSNKGTPGVAKQGLKMMRDGFHMALDNGVPMVKQGVGMNNQVARQKGFAKQLAQGNQIIQTGFQTMKGGAKLFMQGEKLFLQLK